MVRVGGCFVTGFQSEQANHGAHGEDQTGQYKQRESPCEVVLSTCRSYWGRKLVCKGRVTPNTNSKITTFSHLRTTLFYIYRLHQACLLQQIENVLLMTCTKLEFSHSLPIN